MKNLKVAVFNDTSRNGHYGCMAVMSTLIDELRKRNVEIKYFWPVNSDWRSHKEYLINQDVDLIIVNGEGSIHHSKKSSKAKRLGELSFLAKHLKIPSYLINTTVYEIDNETVNLLKGFSKIYVRESGSKTYLSSLGINSSVVPDLSFFTPYLQQNTNFKRKNPLVTDSVKKQDAECLKAFSDQKNYNYVKMIPKKTLASRILKRVSKQFLNQNLPKLKALEDYSGLVNFIKELNKTNLVLTGRFHTTTLAIATHTPVFSLESNTPKIRFLLEDVFQSTQRLIDVKDLKNESVFTTQTTRYSERERVHIDHYLSEGKLKMKRMFDEIVE